MVYLKLIRFKHYLKNLLILFPLLLSENLTERSLLALVAFGIIGFSFLTSVVYVINDLRDLESDRNHSTKQYRPIASGAISEIKAKWIGCTMALLAVFVFIFLLYISDDYGIVVFPVLYLVNNVAYTFKLKQLPLWDVSSIVLGFVLRLLFGAFLIQEAISPLLLLSVVAGGLYFTLGKRKGELNQQSKRIVLSFYKSSDLKVGMNFLQLLMLICYSLWTIKMSHISQWLFITIPMVFIIFYRYHDVGIKNSDGDPIEVVTKDRLLIGMIAGYLLVVSFLIYF